MSRILLIEDNPANLELMSYLLVAFGHSLRTAADGAAGLDAARAEQFDLIVCDVHMPILDGYEVARRLKADPHLRNVPLVAVTALAMVGDRDKVLAAGFDGYVSKPIDPEAFVAQVQRFLGSPPPREPSSAERRLDPPAPTAARQTILVVDNTPVHLELARSILEPHGYRVLTAEGGDEALSLARAQPCDLIISDVCMAGASGYDLIRNVKADPQLASVPFIFLTSTMRNEYERARGLGLGADRFLFRPIEPESLLAEIEACLAEARGFARGNDTDRR